MVSLLCAQTVKALQNCADALARVSLRCSLMCVPMESSKKPLIVCFPRKKNSSKEPSHEIMALFVLRKLILQTRMRSHPVGLDVWFLVEPFVYFHTSCVRTAMTLARLRGCAGSPVLSLVAYVTSTITSWAGSKDTDSAHRHNYSDQMIIILQCVLLFIIYSASTKCYHFWNFDILKIIKGIWTVTLHFVFLVNYRHD